MNKCDTGKTKKRVVCPGKKKILVSLRSLVAVDKKKALEYIDGMLDGKTHDELARELGLKKEDPKVGLGND